MLISLLIFSQKLCLAVDVIIISAVFVLQQHVVKKQNCNDT